MKKINYILSNKKPAKGLVVNQLNNHQFSSDYIEGVAYDLGLWALQQARTHISPVVVEAKIIEKEIFPKFHIVGMIETAMYVGVSKWLDEFSDLAGSDGFEIKTDTLALRVFAETMGHLLTKGMAFYDHFFYINPATEQFDFTFQQYWDDLIK